MAGASASKKSPWRPEEDNMIDQTTGRETVEFDGQTREITAYLSQASRTQTWRRDDREVLSGIIRSDREGRFGDGERIHTSYLIREVAPDVFLTRSNSLYRVESWAPQPAKD
jgi:hypothetical protein